MLGDDAIARYARQIVVPGIGAAGQERLLAARILVVGHPRGVAQATLYLSAAGVRVASRLEEDRFDIVVVADAAGLDSVLHDAVLALDRPICWYTLDDEGFAVGVHPVASLPVSRAAHSEAVCGVVTEALHDAAACDIAALACAIVLGLPHRQDAVDFVG